MSSIADLKKTPHTCPEQLYTQPLTPPETPSLPHLQFRSAKTRCARSSGSRKGKKHQAQMVSHQPVWNPVLTSWPSSSRSSITGTVRSPFMLFNTPPSSPSQRNPNYRTKWLQAYGSNVRGHKVIWKNGADPPEGHHWTLAGTSSVCLQSKQVCGRCSQHGTALCSVISRQTRGLCEDPICGLQLGL